MEKTNRHELHLILDQIPDEGLEEARRLLKELVVSMKSGAPGPGTADDYEYEDEDLSEKELQALQEA